MEDYDDDSFDDQANVNPIISALLLFLLAVLVSMLIYSMANAQTVELKSANAKISGGIITSTSIVNGGGTALQAVVNEQTGAAATPMLQNQAVTGGNASAAFISYQNSSIPAQLIFAHSQSAALGTQTIVASGTALGAISFQGSDGVAFQRGASIRTEVDAAPGAGSMPSRLLFLTTPAASTTPTERLRIDSTGLISVTGTMTVSSSFGASTTKTGAASLTLTAGAAGMSKMTASGSAPGAGGAKLEVVCGTNAGSAKLIMYAGTSTTPVTIVDNVGTGVTGC